MGYSTILVDWKIDRRATVSDAQVIERCKQKIGQGALDEFDIEWEQIECVDDIWRAIGFHTKEFSIDKSDPIDGWELGKYNDYMIDVLDAMAPAYKSGSFIHFMGESNEHFRYIFLEDRVFEQEGVVTWPEIPTK